MRAWCCAALLLLVPIIQAGSAEDPEITDPEDDHKLAGGQNDPDNLVKSVDITKGWVQGVTDAHLELRLQASQQMRGGQVNGNPTTVYDYDYHFSVAGASYTAGATVSGPAPPSVTARGVASSAFIDPGSDSTLVLIVPLESIGQPGPGAVVDQMYVASRVYKEALTVATDRAPDADFGAAYTVPAPTGQVAYENVTGQALDIGNATVDPADAELQFNWTAPVDGFVLHVSVNGTQGEVSINVSAAGWQGNAPQDNGTLFACDCNGTVNETVPAPGMRGVCINQTVDPVACQVVVQVSMRGFVGTWSVTSSAPAAAPGNETAAPTGTPATGNATGNGTADGQDSPLPLAAPLVALAWAAVRRRR